MAPQGRRASTRGQGRRARRARRRLRSAPVPIDLYLCIRYAECETEYAPAPFDDCSCSTSSQKPNRVCEGYTLELYRAKALCLGQATHEPCRRQAIALTTTARPANAARRLTMFPCLPLAVICNFVPGQAVKPEQIENWAPRRQLASTDTLDQVIRCILDQVAHRRTHTDRRH